MRAIGRARKGGGRFVLVVSDTRRLTISGKGDLIKIIGAINVTAEFLELQREIETADGIFVFSPNMFLKDNGSKPYPTLGYIGLLAMLILNPLSVSRRAVLAFGGVRSQGFTWRASLLWGALPAAFEVLLDFVAARQCLMLTSNSHSVELLRWVAVRHPQVERISEIMHGVPTVEFLDYLAAGVEMSGSCANKLALVPSVEGIELGESLSKVRADFAVNLKFNSSWRTTIDDQVNSNFESRNDGFYIVAINGGVSDRVPYFDSHFYKIECAIVREIRRFSLQHNKDVKITYTVHPAHIKSGLHSSFHAALDVDSVQMDSIGSWLTADLCVTLLSSSAWDARQLGCPVLLCVSDADDLYAASTLASIPHVAVGQDTRRALLDALSVMCELPAQSEQAKSGRIKRLRGQ